MKTLVFILSIAYADDGHNPECKDWDAGEKCELDCEAVNKECYNKCDGDMNCMAECSRDYVYCSDHCPCFKECFDGCPCEYETEYCIWHCEDEQINVETFEACQSEAFSEMTNCTESCDISYECHQSCGSVYYENLRRCPCMEQCPDGCPCDSYPCEIADIPKDIGVLVMDPSDPHSGQIKFSLYLNGTWNVNDVTLGAYVNDNRRQHQCSFMIKDEMFIAGGCNSNQDQISKIDGTQINVLANVVDSLHTCIAGSNDEYAIVTAGEKYFLFQSDGNFTKITETAFPHALGEISSINGNIVILIGNNKESYRTEEYNSDGNNWKTVSSVNIWNAIVSQSSAVSMKGYVYTLGGANAENRIFRMNSNYEWNELSETLKSQRTQHKAISNGNHIFIFGGSNAQKIEALTFTDEISFNITEYDYQVTNWSYVPFVFNVAIDDYTS